jgi:hypothetical protein
MTIAASFNDEGFFTQTMAEMVKNPKDIDELVGAYLAVFNATGPGEWNESWTADCARRALVDGAAAWLDCTCVTTWRSGGTLAGFSIALWSPPACFDWEQLVPPSLRGRAAPDAVSRSVLAVAGSAPALVFFRDLGIRPECRTGLQPIRELLAGNFRAAIPAGATFGCFRTSMHCRLFPIMASAGISVVYTFNDPAGYVIMARELVPAAAELKLPLAAVS